MDLSTKKAEFLGRMEVLNKGLMKFLFKSLEEFPGADLTPTINSYLKHVADLDKKYSDGQPSTTADQSSSITANKQASTTVHPPTPTVNRKRTLPPSDELRSFDNKKTKEDASELSSKDAEKKNDTVSEQPTTFPNFFQSNNVAVEHKNAPSFEQAPAAPTNFPNFFQQKDDSVEQNKSVSQEPVTSMNLSFTGDALKKTESGPSNSLLFGGSNTSGIFSMFDNNKSASFSSNDDNKVAETNKSLTLPATQASSSLSFPITQANSSISFPTTQANSPLNFSLFGNTNVNGSKPESNSFTQSDQNGKEPPTKLFSAQPTTKGTDFSTTFLPAQKTTNESKLDFGAKPLFGQKGAESSSNLSFAPPKDNESNSGMFSSFKSNQNGKDLSTSSLFSASKDASGKESSLSGLFSAPKATPETKTGAFPSLQFGQNGKEPSTSLFSAQSNTNGSKSDSCPTFQFTPGGAAPLTIQPSTQQNGTGQEGADENEEPPKVEEVEQKEEGALFFLKTAVFTYKEKKWEKLGIGYVNVMAGDKDNRLLVRAATTLGTIWINTYIAEHFKAFLKGDKAITVRFPDVDAEGKTSVVQFLFKGGDAEEFKKLAEFLKANILK